MSSSSTSTSGTSTMPELDDAATGDAAGVDAVGSTDVARSAGQSVGGGAVDTEELGDALADLVLASAGVLRIEPTLRGAVHAWRNGDGDGPAQHVELTVRGRIVDVGVHLAVAADHQARLLAHRVRERLRENLVGRGLEPGTIEISILVIEPSAD